MGKRLLTGFLLSVLVLTVFLPLRLYAKGREANILLINSYHPGYTWSDDETDAVVDYLMKSSLDYEMYVEYMDSKRYGRKTGGEWLGRAIREKYSGKPFSAVIALDDPAYGFALENRVVFFPGVPVIFCGVSDIEPDAKNVPDNTAGAYEKVEIKGTLDLALNMHTEAERAYIITDRTFNNRLSYRELKTLEPEYSGRVEFVFLDKGHGLSFDTLFDEVESMGPGGIVFYRGFTVDNEGKSMRNEKVLSRVCALSVNPVYVTKTDELGYGALGGVLRCGKEHGKYAAEIAAAVLRGADINSFDKIKELENRSWIDMAQAKRFGVRKQNIPGGTLLLNDEPSYIKRHLSAILTAAAIVAVQAFIIVLLVFNISRRRRAEADLRARALELQEANEELKHFTYAASHDLKEPLRQIKLSVQMAAKKAPGDSAELLDNAVRAVDRLFALLNSMLSYAVIGRQDIKTELFPLKRAAAAAAACVAGMVKTKGAEIAINIPDSVMVDWNAENITFLFQNLFVNAIKFRSKLPPVIEVFYTPGGDGKEAVCGVRDNGIGIAEEYRSKVFDLFYRMHSREDYEGSGLGLAICGRIVKKYGGKIWVESEGVEGKGSVFYFTLPGVRMEKN
ncbi:MAG TPA: hypothetical protein ENN43_02920 [bacterium]|nr:hypothetical protein [bacterium]